MTKELFIPDIKVYCKTVIISNKKCGTYRNRLVEWNGLESSETLKYLLKLDV